MPSKKKKYNARFPAGRIKKIMQTDEEVGKVAQAVPVIISRTLELFVSSLLTKAMQITTSRNAKTLSPVHMKQCILSDPRFDFLKDLVSNIQDTAANGEDEAPASGLLAVGNKSIRERRKSSCSAVKEDKSSKKEETIVKQEPAVMDEPDITPKQETAVKEEFDIVKQELAVKQELDITKTYGAANCSTLRLNPNFYTETSQEQRLSVNRPPVVVGYPGPEFMSAQPPPVLTPYTYPPPTQGYPIPHPELSPSPVLVMDEDYDT